MRTIFFAFLFIAIPLSVCLFTAADTAYAAGAYLTWDANSEENLAGYEIYYKLDVDGEPYNGTGANEGSSPVTVNLADLDNPASPSYSLTGLVAGKTYFFKVKAFGAEGEESDYSNPATLTLSISPGIPPQADNEPPDANAGMDQTVPAGQTVYLDGAGSSDPEGGLTGYQWSQLSGPVVSIANSAGNRASFSAPFTGPEGASLAFLLQVTDAGGLTASDICTVAVTYSNEAPTASAGPDRSAIVGEMVTLDGSGSTDPDDGSETPAPEADPGVPPAEETPAEPETPSDIPDETEPEVPAQQETPSDPEPVDPTPPVEETETTHPDTAVDLDKPVDGNRVPVYPVPVISGKGSTEVMPVQLTLKKFHDPDQGDSHLKTQWRIFREEDNVCVLSTISTDFLTTLPVPDIVFEESTAYYWNARFFDNHGAASGWSEAEKIVIGLFKTDEDDDGVPDEQEVDGSVDLNRDGLPDSEQVIMKSILMPSGDKRIGLSIENSDTVTSILSVEAVDPVAADFSPEDEAKANLLPYGLINFKLGVEHPGDSATVTVHFDAPVPGGAGSMKFNPVQSVWSNYSDHARFSPDRLSVDLEFVDGGFGDDDGVANGVIIDPSGPGSPFSDKVDKVVEPAASTPAEPISTGTAVTGAGSNVVSGGDGGGGGGGCFISGAVGEKALGLPLGLVFLLLIAVTAASCRRVGCRL